MAFSPAFSPAFAGGSGGGSGTVTATGTAGFGLSVQVYDATVFSTTEGYIASDVTIRIGGVDVSAQKLGSIQIEASEDAARIASFSLIPASVAELESYDSASVTLDIVMTRGASSATLRRFTGFIERVEFDPVARIASLSCRDGYQERPRAAQSAAEVEALFDGRAYPNQKLVPWSDVTPDPAGYFDALRQTFVGATFIDSAGLWRAVPWNIGTPAATFGAGVLFDGALKVIRPSRADLPSAVRAVLTHRLPRLHQSEVALTWTRPDRSYYITKGIPVLDMTTMHAALAGLNGWHIKGAPTVVHPGPPYSYAVVVGGQTVYYTISQAAAQQTVDSFSAVAMRRWYQQVDVRYSIDIAVGGSSGRDDSVALSISSTFDTAAWENSSPAETTLPLFAENAPVGLPVTSGYEGMLTPWPPANGAVDHLADISAGDVAAAVDHAVAKAVVSAASGKRRQRLVFSRPIDPRWEIGDVLAVADYGVSATGQVVAFSESIDIDSGACVSEYTLACPDGNGTVTGFSASVTLPTPGVVHGLAGPTMTTCIGSDINETPASPDPETLFGWICNTLPTSTHYSASRAAYETQFRVGVPAIPALHRDPVTLDMPISAVVTIAGSGITLSAF